MTRILLSPADLRIAYQHACQLHLVDDPHAIGFRKIFRQYRGRPKDINPVLLSDLAQRYL